MSHAKPRARSGRHSRISLLLRTVFLALLAGQALALTLPANAELDYTGKQWQCVRGFAKSGSECRKVQIPENGELDYTGRQWQCRRGFVQAGTECRKVQIPENGELDYTGHRWQCRRGFAISGTGCSAIVMPANAEVDYTGNKWQCRRGFAQVGTSCRSVEIPSNAELDYTGRAWKCKRGYARNGSACDVFAVPDNASIDYTGNGWRCDLNFKKAGGKCVRMSSQEIAIQNMLIAQARACGRSYNYDVTGTCGGDAVTGNVDACSNSKEVSGTITYDNGAQMDFTGEWISKGEIEGTDSFGKSCDLEVD